MHGGAGPEDPQKNVIVESSAVILELARRVDFKKTKSALDITQVCIESLESEPIFNAGLGSALQRDGEARLTAAFMDGWLQKFAAVHGLTGHIHPSKIARHLLTKNSRVIGVPGAEMLAKELDLPKESPVTEKRLRAWKLRKSRSNDCDTVGSVCLDSDGRLAAATSTGGRGFEYPGRLSDCGTAAGNFASRFAAISCTGVGEEIVEAGLSVRIETRVRDGMDLTKACELSLKEAEALGHQYGWIAIDHKGNWAVCHTTPSMVFAGMDTKDFVLSSADVNH